MRHSIAFSGAADGQDDRAAAHDDDIGRRAGEHDMTILPPRFPTALRADVHFEIGYTELGSTTKCERQ